MHAALHTHAHVHVAPPMLGLDCWLMPMQATASFSPVTPTHRAHLPIPPTGAAAKKLPIKGIKQYWNNGISACAVCDGGSPLFRWVQVQAGGRLAVVVFCVLC